MSQKNGFSLVELIIVLAAITLIASISFMPLYTTMKKLEIESTISNVAFSVKNIINKTKMQSTKKEIYLKIVYNNDELTVVHEDGTKVFSYIFPQDYILQATPTSLGNPFNETNVRGFYLGYFIDENADSLTINNSYTFFVVSEFDNDVIREIVIEDSLPYIKED